MKYIILDIETSNLNIYKRNITFNRPYGWRTSCCCVYDAYTGNHYYFVKNKEEIIKIYTERFSNTLLQYHPVKESMLECLYNFTEAAPFFKKWYNEGYILITHNGNSFDIPIINKSITHGGLNIKEIMNQFNSENRIIDTCEYLFKQTGYRFSLQNLIKGILGSNESKFMESKEAPVYWNNKNYLSVIGYCIGDCIYTWEVFNKLLNSDINYIVKVKKNKKEFNYNLKEIKWC